MAEKLEPDHKVLHLIGGSLFGGATKMVIAISKDLVAHGFEVHVAASDPTTVENFAAAGIRAHVRPRIRTSISPLFDPFAVYGLVRLCRREGFTVVHTHTSKAGFVGRLAARIAGVPHILHTIHGFAFHESSAALAIRVYSVLEKAAARWSERLIFVNEFHRQWAIALSIVPPRKTVTIPNGLPELPAHIGRVPTVLRSELGLRDDAPVVGAIGRLAPDKRVESVVELMPHVLAEFPSAVLLVVGDGPSKNAVRETVRRLGVDDNVIMTGFVSDVERYYDLVDVVVMPSVREGLSISLLEAMRAGKAIVATTIGSNTTVVKADHSALLVPPESQTALRETVLSLLQNPERAKTLGRHAREAFDADYREELMLDRARKLYSVLLNTDVGEINPR